MNTVHPSDSLELITQKLANVKHNRVEQLRKALLATRSGGAEDLEALIFSLEQHQGVPHSHSLRVRAFSLALARCCGYDREALEDLSYGALLHDVGKFLIPECILRITGKLSEAEMRIMKEHTTRGYRLLSSIPHLQDAALLALLHHERMDGTGYPLGWPGHDIPLSARITMLADSLDVMLTGRPYSAARTFAEARRELIRCAATQFDPDLVDAFLEVPAEEWITVHESFCNSLAAPPTALAAASSLAF